MTSIQDTSTSESLDAIGEDVEVTSPSTGLLVVDDSVEMAVDPPDDGGEPEESDTDPDTAIHLTEEDSGEVIMSDPEAGPSQEGKRVKVYELRDSSWFDRGTGYCRGIYDDSQDLALLVVEAEDTGAEKPGDAEAEGEGGFLKEDLLLTARVEKEDIYVRQQDTLIVWTEPTSNLDIALSFQDSEGCEDIWLFIAEVQRHLNNIPVADQPGPSSSSNASDSPLMGVGGASLLSGDGKSTWEAPTLSNLRQQEPWLRMQAKSAQGRERAVEHIVNEDYIRQLTVLFEQAEDLESTEDLHALCSLMQTILMLNDNTLLEYILQDDIFPGVIGIFEYDREFPTLKASYRQFFSDVAKFKEVVPISDSAIRSKIHQLFRVQYLRDVVLARMLDDGTFSILNGFVFFTQVDIITYVQNDATFLDSLIQGFRTTRPNEDPDPAEPLDEAKRDVVMLLNQLMILGKGVQVPSRMALYRNLLDKGLIFVVEWALRRSEAQILHAGAEIMTLVVDIDVSAVRTHVLKEEEARRRTLLADIIYLLKTTKNMGLLSQVGDSLRNLLDTNMDDTSFLARKEGPISENFINSFFDDTVGELYKPLLDLPEISNNTPQTPIPRERAALLHLLVELLSASITNTNQHQKASYYILSNPISRKVVSLLYIKDKPLRHAALRFIRSCLKLSNHFVVRYFIKNNLFLPLVDLLENESTRDNMLSSACMEVLDIIRKDNIKPVINYLFENCKSRLDALGERPYYRAIIFGLTVRWQQNNEPPPPPVQPETSEQGRRWQISFEKGEEDYFNASDDEDDVIGPKQPNASSSPATPEGDAKTPRKRKRQTPIKREGPTPPRRPAGPSPSRMTKVWKDPNPGIANPGTGLVDYDDGSDSDSSAGAQSPLLKPLSSAPEGQPDQVEEKPSVKLEEDLGDVAMKMRQKREREEEEEEGFAGLLVKSKKAASPDKAVKKEDEAKPVINIQTQAGLQENGAKVEGEKRITPTKAKKEDRGKKIRLNFGIFKQSADEDK